ncbi:hypothetical protein [Aquimarina rhabdastrellae]
MNSFCQETKFSCIPDAHRNLILQAISSFENDLTTHYEMAENDPELYATFLSQVASLSLDLRKLPSSKSIAIARDFKRKNIENLFWIPLSEYELDSTSAIDDTPNTTATAQEVLTFNYRGDLMQCLKNNTQSLVLKQIISDLSANANISPSIISSQLKNLEPQSDLITEEVKMFIAFDIYYSILLIIENAFE